MCFNTSLSSDYRATSYFGGHKLYLTQGTDYLTKTFRGLTTGECCVTVFVIRYYHAPAHLSHSAIHNYCNIQRYTTCSV